MTTETRPSGIVVARFSLFDPFAYLDGQGFDIHEDAEAEHAGLITNELAIEFHPALHEGESVIRVELACVLAKAMGIPGGLRAWARAYECYASQPEEIRRELAGKWLYFTGTVLRRRDDGRLYVPALRCGTDRCDRLFDCLGRVFDAGDRMSLLRGK